MKDEFWITRDGTKIAVGDMSETHVRNALRMVIRRWREDALAVSADEACFDEDHEKERAQRTHENRGVAQDRARLIYISRRGRDEWGWT